MNEKLLAFWGIACKVFTLLKSAQRLEDKKQPEAGWE